MEHLIIIKAKHSQVCWLNYFILIFQKINPSFYSILENLIYLVQIVWTKE